MSKSESVVKIDIGPGFSTILTAVFVTLKLLSKIDWSWWWVLSPIWISVCLWLAIVFVIMVVAAVSK